MIDFKDLDDGLNGSTPAPKMTEAELRARTNMANGGEQALFPCQKCSGTGMTRWGRCFQCQGKGKRTMRSIAATKARVTREANFEAWRAENAELIRTLDGMSDWNTFARAMVDVVCDERRMWTENQLAAIHRMLAKIAEKREAKKVERAAEQAAKSGAVDLSAVHALFSKATSKGLKKPIFRGEKVTVKQAKKYEGVLYVTDTATDTYLGKIANGKFEARREATAETLPELRMICDDPEKALFAYSRSTAEYDAGGRIISVGCGICGKSMTDPESIERGIGPICAGKWGL